MLRAIRCGAIGVTSVPGESLAGKSWGLAASLETGHPVAPGGRRIRFGIGASGQITQSVSLLPPPTTTSPSLMAPASPIPDASASRGAGERLKGPGRCPASAAAALASCGAAFFSRMARGADRTRSGALMIRFEITNLNIAPHVSS
ncbi:hypothetical protein BN1110_00829 [bacterium YEK0313]|nr:hypothetical protein BN1110_00829 [bacterium YEK0313]